MVRISVYSALRIVGSVQMLQVNANCVIRRSLTLKMKILAHVLIPCNF
jgi:hypothetical protein